ncbi:BREX-3 system phosphatase PglZ [Caloramator australicus]|uniref:PglZ domain-containing protein n=1 Tax=Caloramator australicus RC3 TaxID=857293 RepID=I7LJQ1_9CLOT|nr:BREX-3 system phosphatase PglZ [Caloramator australicus]CCJ33848.1 hypothetical protein CAAU_1764 [Caloramator australicus RC3]
MNINDILLRKIPLNLYEHILIFDFDNLISNELIIEKILKEGYEIFEFKDIEYYRIYFEAECRNSSKKLILIVNDNVYIPYDIKEDYFLVDISLNDIFKNIDVRVLKYIARENYGIIYEKAKNIKRILSYEETCDFLLKNVYYIDIQLINTFNDLIKIILRLYYKGIELPSILVEHLYERLNLDYDLLNEILMGKDKFFNFLQNQWEMFVNSFINPSIKSIVDFNDTDIKVYIDNLFSEGYLHSVDIQINDNIPEFAKIGIILDRNSVLNNEYGMMINKLKKKTDSISDYKDWIELAKIFGEIVRISCILNKEEYKSLSLSLNDKFKNWLYMNYGKLPYLSYFNGPVMIHQIQHYIINTIKKEKKKKVILIVFDCMSQFNWSIIKHYLNKKGYLIEDKACFAWIPTITSVSRQALFSGEIPINFKETLFTSNYDEKHFKNFFINHGYNEKNIMFFRNVKTFEEEGLQNALEKNVDVIGIVVDLIDRFVHNQMFDYKGLYNNIEFYLNEGYLDKFFTNILEYGYEIFITSDHGNISAIGQGNVKEGVLLETLSSRIAVYENDLKNIYLNDKKIIEWIGTGLPNEYNYIICDNNYSFYKDGESILSHGGISFEEVIVPFARIKH